jgi:predicted metal-binding protein
MPKELIMVIEFNPSKMLCRNFKDKVREQCKSCKRYGYKATCPPHVESVEYYKHLLPKYEKGVLFILEFNVASLKSYKEIGKSSSLALWEAVTKYRDSLIREGVTYYNAFGAGSCKLCESCKFPCRFPSKSLIPLGATGLDVIEFVKDVTKIEIKFPVVDKFYRVGGVFYDA